MKHLDITFDLETLGLSSYAAVMQIAAVVWDRNLKENPFVYNLDLEVESFNQAIDLRTCVFDGFEFNQDTLNWWAKQNSNLKVSLLLNEELMPINEAFSNFIYWIADVKEKYDAESVCLWCQGSDFDISILKNVCKKYQIDLPIKYTDFRDARTFILETIYKKDAGGFSFENVGINYKDISPLPTEFEKQELILHNALYDCLKTTWNVWQMMKN